jgi:hypothetical protein
VEVPLITYFATTRHMGFAVPILIAGIVGSASFIGAIYLGPETKGKVLHAALALLRRFGSDADDVQRFRPQNAKEINGD